MDSSNGHGNSGDVRLQKLLAYHEGVAAAIRTVLVALNGLDTFKKAAKQEGIIAAALAIDGQRRSGGTKKEQLSKRERVHQMLSKYAAGETLPAEMGKRWGALVLHGYLRRDDAGRYVRTDKTHYANPLDQKAAEDAAADGHANGNGKTQIAAVLAQLAPRDLLPEGALRYGKGVLVHHGYLRKTAKGYVRTAKPYPLPEAAA